MRVFATGVGSAQACAARRPTPARIMVDLAEFNRLRTQFIHARRIELQAFIGKKEAYLAAQQEWANSQFRHQLVSKMQQRPWSVLLHAHCFMELDLFLTQMAAPCRKHAESA